MGVVRNVQLLLRGQFSEYVSGEWKELGRTPFLQGDCPFPEARAHSQQLALPSSEQSKLQARGVFVSEALQSFLLLALLR